MAAPVIVDVADIHGVTLAVEWAAREGWNPGLHDAACFWAAGRPSPSPP